MANHTLKRRPIKYIWRDDSDSHCISKKDYQTILDGCISGEAKFSVKIDGCRIRLGKDEFGNKLFYSGRQIVPFRESDGLSPYLKRQIELDYSDTKAIERAKGYDTLMRRVMQSGVYDAIRPTETCSFECVSRFVFETIEGNVVKVISIPYILPDDIDCILVSHSTEQDGVSSDPSIKIVNPSLSLSSLASRLTPNIPREALKTALQSSFESCGWDGIAPASGFAHEGIVVQVGNVVGKIRLSNE